jgi:hypothetical protein
MNLEDYVNNLNKLEGISFKNDSVLIAIGKKIRKQNQSMLLTSADLSACYLRTQIYICKRHQVLGYDLEVSCLGALFT